MLAHRVVGPLLGSGQPAWGTDFRTIAVHTVDHIAFGVVTAAGAKIAA